MRSKSGIITFFSRHPRKMAILLFFLLGFAAVRIIILIIEADSESNRSRIFGGSDPTDPQFKAEISINSTENESSQINFTINQIGYYRTDEAREEQTCLDSFHIDQRSPVEMWQSNRVVRSLPTATVIPGPIVVPENTSLPTATPIPEKQLATFQNAIKEEPATSGLPLKISLDSTICNTGLILGDGDKLNPPTAIVPLKSSTYPERLEDPYYYPFDDKFITVNVDFRGHYENRGEGRSGEISIPVDIDWVLHFNNWEISDIESSNSNYGSYIAIRLHRPSIYKYATLFWLGLMIICIIYIPLVEDTGGVLEVVLASTTLLYFTKSILPVPSAPERTILDILSVILFSCLLIATVIRLFGRSLVCRYLKI